MPRQNRVTPTGDLISTPHRGTLLGNRGVLHDAEGTVIRHSQHRRWLICTLTYRGRRRIIMQPNRYTELFFLDETVALAAGHRPCAKCRRRRYDWYRDSWAGAVNRSLVPTANAIDDALHLERTTQRGGSPRRERHPEELPDGVHVLVDGSSWLVHRAALIRWTPAGYDRRRSFPASPAIVLTPPSTVAAIAAGYTPEPHPSAYAF